MKGSLLALFLLAALSVIGCKGDDKAGAPVQPGDYAAEPGQKRK